ncbi:hypothetical protein Tcan_01029, partial [Toxocara canis]
MTGHHKTVMVMLRTKRYVTLPLGPSVRCLDVTEAIARRAQHSHSFGCFSLLLTIRWLGYQWYGGSQPGIEPGSPRARSGVSTTELLPPYGHKWNPRFSERFFSKKVSWCSMANL